MSEKCKTNSHIRQAICAAVLALMLILSAALTTACSGTDVGGEGSLTATADEAALSPITKITVKGSSRVKLKAGESKTVDFTVYSDEDITAEQLSAAITGVTVEKNTITHTATVTIEGRKGGEAILLLKNIDGSVESSEVGVTVTGVAQILFDDASMDLTVGETKTVRATIRPAGVHSSDVKVSVDNESIVNFSDVRLKTADLDLTELTLTVKGLSAGEATVKIEAKDNDVNDFIYVEVKEKPTEKPTEKPVEQNNSNSNSYNSNHNNSYNTPIVDNNSGSGTIVYITDTGTKYHRKGCSSLSKSCYAISLEDAKAQGYTPCQKCH